MASGFLLRRANPLAYPGGQPRFNRNHFAAQGCIFAPVSDGASSYNLCYPNQLPTAMASAPSAIIDSLIGPSSKFTGVANNGLTFSGGATATADTVVTFAAIYKPATSGANNNFILSNSSSFNTGVTFWDSSTNGLSLSANNNLVSSITLTAGVPWFIVASMTGPSGGTFNANYLARRLDTGQIFTATNSGSQTPTAGNGSPTFGGAWNAGSVLDCDGNLACGMYNKIFLSLAQMKQWAEDPWDFWYSEPRRELFPATIFGIGTTAYGGIWKFPKRPSPLSYPGSSTRAGVNQNHVALRNAAAVKPVLVDSLAAIGNPWMNSLLTGAKGGAGPATAVLKPDALLGSYELFGSALDQVYTPFSSLAYNGVNPFTVASIVKFTTFPSSGQFVSLDGNLSAPTGPSIVLSSNNITLLGASLSFNIFNSVNVPYFIAISAVKPGSAGTKINAIVVNLANGKFQTVSTTVVTAAAAAASGGYLLGIGTASAGCAMDVATFMWSQTALGLAELSAWGADPWSFWYPAKAWLPMAVNPTIDVLMAQIML